MTNIKTVFTGLAVVLMFVTSSVAYAESDTEKTTEETTEQAIARLEKQISELIKVIALLQEQFELKNTTVKQYDDSSDYSSYRLSENLYLGSKSDEVTWLQDFLATHYSSLYPEKEVTGYYGTMTEAAVERFQEKYGIESVGEVGPQTRAKINSMMDAKSYKYKSYVEKSSSKSIDKTVEIDSEVASIDLEYLGDGEITWDVDGVSSQGFKIVWSMNENPTYPTRSGDKYIYLSDKNAAETTVYAFDEDGTYYVRVCEYLGGKCGEYSNEIEVELN